MTKYVFRTIKQPGDIWIIYCPPLNLPTEAIYSQDDIDNILMPWKNWRDSLPGFQSATNTLIDTNTYQNESIFDTLANAQNFITQLQNPEVVVNQNFRNLYNQKKIDYNTNYSISTWLEDENGNII